MEKEAGITIDYFIAVFLFAHLTLWHYRYKNMPNTNKSAPDHHFLHLAWVNLLYTIHPPGDYVIQIFPSVRATTFTPLSAHRLMKHHHLHLQLRVSQAIGDLGHPSPNHHQVGSHIQTNRRSN